MDLNHAYYLVHVVEKQGFSAAARTLGIPKSRISRQVKTLEETLGTRLLNRDSRHMSLTEAGEAYYRHAKMALDCMVAAEAAVRKDKNALEGAVTLSCSVGVAQFALSRILPRFLAENPRIVLHLQASNDYSDMIGDGIDLAIRGHARLLPDSGLIQRRITDVPWHLFGSPDLAKHLGASASPTDLEGQPGLALGWRPGSSAWSLQGAGGSTASVPYPVRMRCDDMVSLKEAAAAGLGVVALPAYVCAADVAAGRLSRLLPDWTAGLPEISLLMHERRGNPPQVDAFAAFLRRELPDVMNGGGNGYGTGPSNRGGS
ncbi:LysR substrate-binding domain-containing protein [uncultured Mameliella sp.]|uniref:LysR substrate-binding domain-containing protein n=1 Tax=uncultured Mameliella sp. TaxID=1447087 RepID=UPI00260F049A|nr:LysR substrate-binding domain-containing protein [uncultured Mameliella sp.]